MHYEDKYRAVLGYMKNELVSSFNCRWFQIYFWWNMFSYLLIGFPKVCKLFVYNNVAITYLSFLEKEKIANMEEYT